jgi:hypothetical protein
MDLTRTASNATMRIEIFAKGAEAVLSTYHWGIPDRQAANTAVYTSRLDMNAQRLSELLCATRVVVQPDCAETYVSVRLEVRTILSSASLADDALPPTPRCAMPSEPTTSAVAIAHT